MIGSSVTISMVPEACGGPFVFWDDLAASMDQASQLGFDAVEVFPPAAGAVRPDQLRGLLEQYGLKLAAVGTGAGWLIGRLSLTDADPARREQARRFVRDIIDLAGALVAPAIIGSMQGRLADASQRSLAMDWLGDALAELGNHALRYGVPLLLEPLNRYETNLVNTLDDGVAIAGSPAMSNVKLLADLFHMNIEEVDLAAAICRAGDHVGHVHLADSNRRAAGSGHTDFGPIAAALRRIDYRGYCSAEVLPLPDPIGAARRTMDTFNRFFR